MTTPSQFPSPPSLPRQYTTPTPDNREDDDPEAWRDEALCAQTDPEAFFPERGGSVREPKKVCLACEVRAQCLQYALDNNEQIGIWGGLSTRQRAKLRRERAA